MAEIEYRSAHRRISLSYESYETALLRAGGEFGFLEHERRTRFDIVEREFCLVRETFLAGRSDHGRRHAARTRFIPVGLKFLFAKVFFVTFLILSTLLLLLSFGSI